MGIKQITQKNKIKEFIEKKIKDSEETIIRKFCYIGESCISTARSTGNYSNITGNLRNSIGYVVIMDGKIQEQTIADSGKEREQTAVETIALIERLVDKYSKGIVLVVFAGMKYAAYVSARGYDVLDSAELLARDLVPVLLGKIGFKRV